MYSKQISPKYLDQILDMTIQQVSESKQEIIEIGELSRTEYERLLKSLEHIKEELAKIIDESDILEEKMRLSRKRLAQVSREFKKYSEEEIRTVYENAKNLQVKLEVLRQRELELRERRDELERRVVQVKETIAKSESLTGKISIVLNYLNGDMKQVGELIEDANRKQAFGLRILEAQEEERRRLSREIHDGPAQLLANTLLRTEIIEKKINSDSSDSVIEEVRQLRYLVREALKEVRGIIYDLRPMALDDLGLVPALMKYLSAVEENVDIPVHFQLAFTDRRFSMKLETAVFRLIQESVQNACKHSQASQIEVKLEFQKDSLSILIRDNGVGFQVEKQREDSFGLIGMSERVDLLGGKITIHSEPNEGTAVMINIPIKQDEGGAT